MGKTSIKGTEADPVRTAAVYDQIVHTVAEHLRQQGFSSVKANTEGFCRPDKIKWEEEHEGIIPDIMGEYNGSVYVFAIETRDELKAPNVEDRWRLLSAHARRHKGKFYLVTPETKARYLQKFAQRLNVQPEFLKLSGIE